MPQHMSDVGTDNFEQEFNLDLAESERRLVKEIDEALMRIYNSVYGVCLVTGAPIGKPRLDAKPWAKYTIETVRELERLGKL
jgi:RNA polymerase-binding transcription factor DksA